jgi:rubredoxin
MFNQILSVKDVRSLILNAHKIKKDHVCHKCNGTGYENWNGETGDDIKPGRLTNFDDVRIDGECENCDGIGYVDIFIYSE